MRGRKRNIMIIREALFSVLSYKIWLWLMNDGDEIMFVILPLISFVNFCTDYYNYRHHLCSYYCFLSLIIIRSLNCLVRLLLVVSDEMCTTFRQIIYYLYIIFVSSSYKMVVIYCVSCPVDS